MPEEKLRSTGRSVDLAQRVSHSFSFLAALVLADPVGCLSESSDMLLREATCRWTLPLMLSGRRGAASAVAVCGSSRCLHLLKQKSLASQRSDLPVTVRVLSARSVEAGRLRIPSHSQVMLKWVFDGLPFQCGTTGRCSG